MNQSSGLSEVDRQELEAGMASPMPSRKALMDHSEVFSNGDVQDPEHIDSEQEQVREAVRSLLQSHDRMDSGRRYCLLVMIHEATCQGCRAIPKPMWNPSSIADMMRDDLDIMEAIVLDHITAILYVGR